MSLEEPSDRKGDASARNVVFWAGLALLVALAAAGWWASKLLTIPRAFSEPSSADSVAPDTPDAIDTLGDAASPVAATNSAGVVRVRVLDVNDGSALEGIEVVLFAEEPVGRRFGLARSDKRGEVRFEGVFAPLVLAKVRRSERFAAALTVARGDIASERSAVLRLGPGGTLSGRVVDDQGAALEGASLYLPDTSSWPDTPQPAQLVGRTARDGTYHIERVVDTPRMITARDGMVFAAAWSAVIVEARASGGTRAGSHSVRTCLDATMPDIVLPRPPSFSGRVLDSAKRPVSGALVSVNPTRQRLSMLNLPVVDRDAVAQGAADLPGSARFALLDGEALSADDGTFSLRGTPGRPSALVALADGRLEDFPLGSWSAAEHVEGLEFVLAQREVLRMRFFDADGQPILGEAPSAKENSTAPDDLSFVRISPINAPQMTAWNSSKVELFAELSDGRELRVQSAPTADGAFSFALATPLAAIERLSISAPGYKTRVRECHGRLRQESVVANERLERLDTLELSFERSGELEDPPGSEPQDVQVRACMLAPQSAVSDPGHPRPACCGFGMFAQFKVLGPKRRISMPMLNERPFWLSVRTSRAGQTEEFVAGPFRAGEEVQTIELPALAPGRSAFDHPLPSAVRSDPRAVDAWITASLCVFDSQSGASLPGANVWVLCDPLGREAWLGRTWITDSDGCAALDGVYAGSWTLVVSAPGHRARVLGPLEISSTDAAGSEADLGLVRLAPVD